MEHGSPLIASVGLADRTRASRWPARLDLDQSLTGLVLVLFMWGHMFFVSSILLGKDAMWTVTKFFEGYFLFGRSYPWIVSLVVRRSSRWWPLTRCSRCASSPRATASTPFRGHMRIDAPRGHDALVLAGLNRQTFRRRRDCGATGRGALGADSGQRQPQVRL